MVGATVVTTFALVACGGEEGRAEGADDSGGAPPTSEAAAAPADGPAEVITLLAEGEAVFGKFVSGRTTEDAAADALDEEADFVLYSLERGPFDMETMGAYIGALRATAAEAGLTAPDVMLRTPPIGDDVEGARDRVRRAVDTGVDGIVFPHAHSAAEAALSIDLVGSVWPADRAGERVDILIVEDREGIEHVREIVGTPGLSVVFAGPGDLRRAYEGDAEAIEGAIQRVLAACREFDVACGITAGVDDIADRLEQGFRVIIVTEEEALAVGRAAAGR